MFIFMHKLQGSFKGMYTKQVEKEISEQFPHERSMNFQTLCVVLCPGVELVDYSNKLLNID